MVPKKMLTALFSLISQEDIDKLSEQRANESRNIALLSGTAFTTETVVDFTRICFTTRQIAPYNPTTYLGNFTIGRTFWHSYGSVSLRWRKYRHKR